MSYFSSLLPFLISDLGSKHLGLFVAFDYLKLIQHQSLQQQVCIFAAHEKVTQVQHFRNKTDHWEAMTASTGS